MRPTLLLTRPAAQSARFAAEFRARFGAGWPVVISPLTELVFLDAALEAKAFGSIVFTSETGVAAFARLASDRSAAAWCVGQRTAAAARDAGFAVREGPGDGKALAEAMIAGGVTGPVLVVRGRHQAIDIAQELSDAGIPARSEIVYDQPEIDLTAAARRLLGGDDPVLLPLFSQRAARLAVAGIAVPHAPLLVASISPAVASVADALMPSRQEIAERPGSEAVLDALGRLAASA